MRWRISNGEAFCGYKGGGNHAKDIVFCSINGFLFL